LQKLTPPEVDGFRGDVREAEVWSFSYQHAVIMTRKREEKPAEWREWMRAIRRRNALPAELSRLSTLSFK
jgi:hypothetical protein